MKNVQVLMSTYNGEKYLKEQLESILNQKGVRINILVRDDGSKDNTISILKEYKEIKFFESNNIGCTQSFLELIKYAGDYDFYAFADQDDVWDEDKILIATQYLKSYKKPALYSSDTRLVDENLNFIKNEFINPTTTLGSAISKNYVTGCTTVFNSMLMNYLKKYSPKSAPFHDWWANLVCLAVGGFSIYDNKPHISYRQHGNNVVSGNNNLFIKWFKRLQKFNKPYHRELFVKELIENYSDHISSQNKYILNSMLNKKYIKEMRTKNFIDDILFRICIFCGKV